MELTNELQMKNILPIIFGILFLLPISLFAQNEFLHQGNAEYVMRDFDQAVVSYAEYLKSKPKDKETLLRMATSYEHLNDLENAAVWYEKALSYSVTTENILKYGKLLMRLGQYENAKKQFLGYSTVDKTVGSNYAKMCDNAFAKKEMMPLFRVSKLPISSDSPDFSPTIFNNSLVYVSGRTDIPRADAANNNAGKNPTNNYIFKSEFVNGAVVLESDYVRSWFRDNNGENEGPISYSPDGKWVAFVKNKYKKGNSITTEQGNKTNIYIAELTQNGDWETEVAFPFSGDYSNHYPSLSADGSTLFFSSDKPGGQGGFDLYQSTKKNGVWTEPRNLGNKINTPGNEISPYIDESELYFSSDYHMGFGGYDVFKAVIEDRTWVLSNLGTGVNTPSNDFGYIYSKRDLRGFMVSDRDGDEDIFVVSKTASDLNILISDGADKKPIPSAVLDFSKCGQGFYRANADGRFGIKASEGLECKVIIMRDGYENYELELDKKSIALGIVEVQMFRKGEKYDGNVVDGNTDEAVANATVRVFNQTDGTKMETRTNADGIYYLGLKPNSRYMITFSKKGYVDVTVKPETKDGSDKSILGTLNLFPTSASGMPSVPSPSPPTVPTVVTTPTVPTTPSSPTIPTVVNTPQPPSVPSPTSINSGFAIQLITLSSGNKKRPDGLEKIQGMVTKIYTKSDEKWRRYRVGVYGTREEAKQVRAYVRAMGFSSAYIVEEDATGLIQDVVFN